MRLRLNIDTRSVLGKAWFAGCLACLCALGACSKDLVVAKQCPSPLSGEASIEGDNASSEMVFGTTCAPCGDGDEVRFDDDGCPIYVTFESCGGDVCIGGTLVRERMPDAGAGDAGADAGTDAGADGGPGEAEDGGT